MKKENSGSKRKPEFNYFRKKVDEAKWLIEALKSAGNIHDGNYESDGCLQRDFFPDRRKKNLKPMIS